MYFLFLLVTIHIPLHGRDFELYNYLLFTFKSQQLHSWKHDAYCAPQSYTIIFLSGTHSYIDGTKDWKMMKKRLRFQMPHVPLKALQ